jgi:pimeloyl-ACP methyl ester carboxylesterase
MQIIENAGHFLQLEQPHIVNAAIVSFLTHP